jgi:hypothetical protein
MADALGNCAGTRAATETQTEAAESILVVVVIVVVLTKQSLFHAFSGVTEIRQLIVTARNQRSLRVAAFYCMRCGTP